MIYRILSIQFVIFFHGNWLSTGIRARNCVPKSTSSSDIEKGHELRCILLCSCAVIGHTPVLTAGLALENLSQVEMIN